MKVELRNGRVLHLLQDEVHGFADKIVKAEIVEVFDRNTLTLPICEEIDYVDLSHHALLNLPKCVKIGRLRVERGSDLFAPICEEMGRVWLTDVWLTLSACVQTENIYLGEDARLKLPICKIVKDVYLAESFQLYAPLLRAGDVHLDLSSCAGD